MAAPKKTSSKGGTAVLEKPQSKTELTPEVPEAQLAKVGKSLDQQMTSEASTTPQTAMPTNGTLPLSGITLADVQSKMAEIDGHITALEGRIRTFRQERGFHEQVVATYWPAQG
jgi:hypothetical protein